MLGEKWKNIGQSAFVEPEILKWKMLEIHEKIYVKWNDSESLRLQYSWNISLIGFLFVKIHDIQYAIFSIVHIQIRYCAQLFNCILYL